jgi:hypothetical protein
MAPKDRIRRFRVEVEIEAETESRTSKYRYGREKITEGANDAPAPPSIRERSEVTLIISCFLCPG